MRDGESSVDLRSDVSASAPTKPGFAVLTWRVLGFACVGIGATGVVVPLLPTTLFLILALACFTRGSPKLAAKLLAHPRFGPALHAWQQHRAIPKRAKALAVFAMVVATAIAALSTEGWPVPTLVGAILLCVGCYVVTRPTAETSNQDAVS